MGYQHTQIDANYKKNVDQLVKIKCNLLLLKFKFVFIIYQSI